MSTRQERERDFHDHRFANGPRKSARKYYEVDAGKAAYRELVLRSGNPGTRVLEYGCGTGSLALDLARNGADVVGIDISSVALARARKRTKRAKLTVEFVEMDAQALEFPDGSFDVVNGSGILHHLDLAPAVAEIRRVLRPDGVAVFVEPLGHNPLINLYRRFTPTMRSIDEAPLRLDALDVASTGFRECRLQHFDLTALAGAPIRRFERGARVVDRLHRVDRWLFARSALARRLAWVVVVELRDPLPSSADQGAEDSQPSAPGGRAEARRDE